MLTKKLNTKILVDGGDPSETLRVKSLLGFVDGQTTNPSLIAKNPEIQRRIASGHTLTPEEEKDEYRKIVQAISPLVGKAGVSIEVFADCDTKADEMLEDDGSPDTAHSLNPVPLIVTVAGARLRAQGGILADVAPTILALLGIEQPPEMTGRTLLLGARGA